MPRKVSKKAGYTQAQKLAYYKAKAARQYVGRGAYKPAPKSRAVGEKIGQGIGSAFSFLPGGVGTAVAPVASQLIGKLGGFLGNKLGSIMGWGSYTVNRNSLTVPEGNSPASMHTNGMTTRISHREYIGDVISDDLAGVFNLKSYKMQPGAPDMFPWLSDIANNYQKYKMLGAIVEFKSGSGDVINGTNTALGEVIISSNYNNADPNFTSRNQMENTQYCSSAKPSVSFVHVIECDPSLQAQEALYTSASVTPITGLSPNDINWCNVQVATVGCQGSLVNLGSLYITYEVELIQPIEQSAIRRPATDIFQGTNTYTNALPLAGAVADAGNSIGGSITTPGAGNTYVFPESVREGLYMIVAYWQCNTNNAYTPPNIALTGGSLATILVGDSVSFFQSPTTGISTTRLNYTFFVKVTAPSCEVNFSGTGSILTGVAVNQYLIVSQMDASFLPALNKKVKPEPTRVLHSRDTIREEYHTALKDCEDAGESEMIERLKRKLAELENKSPALAYQVDRLNHQ